MSKGLFCAKCMDIRMLDGSDLSPVSCRCGNTIGWWLDGRRGIARYTADTPAYAWGLGFTNTMLRYVHDLYGNSPTPEEWREAHDAATDSPGFFFDKSGHACWSIFFKPGKVRDVEWASNDERAAVGLPPYPERHALAPKPSSASGGPEGGADRA